MNGYGWAAISVSVIAIISLIVITLLSQKDQPDDEHKLIPSDNEYKMSNNGSGWWPQPQWGKKTVRDDNEIYASTDICPGPFTILDGWPKEEHLQESTDPSRLGDPLCVRNNNFAKDADESQWFKTNTYYKNSSGDAVSDMWQDYQDYLVKPFLRKRDMGEEINYYWEQYLNKENFYKPGTPGPDQIQSIYSDGPSTQGMHDLDKLMCPVLDYRNLSNLLLFKLQFQNNEFEESLKTLSYIENNSRGDSYLGKIVKYYYSQVFMEQNNKMNFDMYTNELLSFGGMWALLAHELRGHFQYASKDYENALKNFNKIIQNQQSTVSIKNRAQEMIDNIYLYYDKNN